MKTTLNGMTTKQKVKAFNDAFSSLSYALDNITWTPYVTRCYEMALSEERRHRSGDFAAHHTHETISANDAARMFVVKRVAGYLVGDRMPRGKAFLHCQQSCFCAAGLADEYRKEIRKAWKDYVISELADLDYCEFVKTRAVA